MTLEELRPNVLVMTATRQEIGTLAAAARLALDVILHDPDAPPTAADTIVSVLRDYDAALSRLEK